MTDSHLMLGRGLDAAAVIVQCARNWVPVNVDMDVAIEAHELAPGAQTLRAVVLAAAPTVEDLRKQLAYLESLRDEAWSGYDPEPGHPPDELRNATLRAIGRCIADRGASIATRIATGPTKTG